MRSRFFWALALVVAAAIVLLLLLLRGPGTRNPPPIEPWLAYLPVELRVNLFHRRRAQRAATRTVIALRLFERRHGKLPVDLNALVDEGLLERVPAAPFVSGPLKYSPERRLLWSAGVDGRDDGGVDLLSDEGEAPESAAEGDPATEDAPEDLVWTLPPLAP